MFRLIQVLDPLKLYHDCIYSPQPVTARDVNYRIASARIRVLALHRREIAVKRIDVALSFVRSFVCSFVRSFFVYMHNAARRRRANRVGFHLNTKYTLCERACNARLTIEKKKFELLRVYV